MSDSKLVSTNIVRVRFAMIPERYIYVPGAYAIADDDGEWRLSEKEILAALRAAPRAEIDTVRRIAKGHADFWADQAAKNTIRSEHYEVISSQFQRLAREVAALALQAAQGDAESADGIECAIGVSSPMLCSAGHCRRCSDFREGWNAALSVSAAEPRGNYEDRHPQDRVMVRHPLSEIKEWDEALAVLGIQDSDQTPADAIRELYAEIERLRGLTPPAADRGTP